ncbi:MAG: cobaltochelatase subunit CobN [Myxococcota bacterium]|nr:cobaltochelatase subunit CobN [Myxococcota bacterium]
MMMLLTALCADAATLLAVVSSRSAAELTAGAHRFLDDNPDHTVLLRTTDQLAEMTDEEIRAAWAAADAVLLGGVFGEEVPRLERLVQGFPARDTTLLALHGDPRLTTLAQLDGAPVFSGLDADSFTALTGSFSASGDPEQLRQELSIAHPRQAPWLQARAYWQARGSNNFAGLMGWMLARHDDGITVSPPAPRPVVRWMQDGEIVDAPVLPEGRQAVVVLDYDSGDRAGDAALHGAICDAARQRALSCVSLLARWGEASVTALESIPAQQLSSIVSIQDFVIGGGGGRVAATAALEALDVPVIKGIRMVDMTTTQWRLSESGIPWEGLYSRVAMPELQGQGQPAVIGALSPATIDSRTGVRLAILEPIPDEVDALVDRLARWAHLQVTDNADKRVAIVYYNHPPGRHNIGADNLDVPASLISLLGMLGEAGYDVGSPPADSESLLEQMQARAVNLPEDAGAVAEMADAAQTLSRADYARHFATLPLAVQQEVTSGPLARLSVAAQEASAAGEIELARQEISQTLGDVHHLVEGVQTPHRQRASDLLDQLEVSYEAALSGDTRVWGEIDELTSALQRTGIEGLRGWGEAPGIVMTHGDQIVLPGLVLGNVFMGPQPPRGWELNEELLHANLAFPPHHQYIAWYHHIRDVWEADVVIHVGRHSTLEFLPGKRAGLLSTDYPRLLLGDLPNAYIYIVDGVGEGIQAKRRGMATIVDHLTPSLSATPLYDDLLTLRQLVESYEAAEHGGDSTTQQRAIDEIRVTIARLDLQAELEESMAEELEVRGISYAQVDDEMLVHEVGHYLTHLQEDFMPHGLHVFGTDWDEAAVERMVESMGEVDAGVRSRLISSPGAERVALLAALEGRFISPGEGNDPIRTPEALPTGRNFHALGGELVPSRLAWTLGSELSAEALSTGTTTADGREAVVLWASDTVRDEGAMIAFGLSMLGVEPVWNSRGVVKGIQRMPLLEGAARRDVTFVTSGLFRDLYPNMLVWLDRAVLHALAGSQQTIEAEYPLLSGALSAALVPVVEETTPGDELLAVNQVAAHWVVEAQAQLDAGVEASMAGRLATYRVFGNAPGGYGAGINRLAERSGAWSDRSELAAAYTRRMGHAYGDGFSGDPVHSLFTKTLAATENTYLGRASNLYGLIDNNDGFDYLGGLSLAVESARGQAPAARIVDHANPENARVRPLEVALLSELRGRELNPVWLEGLMNHGYAGARTMGSEFMENLWGWQVTNPDIVQPWVWDEVKRVYIDDGHDIGLDEFLEEGRNVHVKTNMLAIMLVAAQKGYWEPDEQTLAELSEEFAALVTEHGLPGSGHTRPDHPVMDFVKERIGPEQTEALSSVLAAAQVQVAAAAADPTTITEVSVEESEESASRPELWAVAGLLGVLLLGGVWMGSRRVS